MALLQSLVMTMFKRPSFGICNGGNAKFSEKTISHRKGSAVVSPQRLVLVHTEGPIHLVHCTV